MVLKANEISSADFYKALEILKANNKWEQTHATTNRAEIPYPRQAPQRHQPEADSV